MNESINQQWIFFYDVEHILNEVENITATIASRPIDKDGNIRPYLILTRDHDALSQRLIKDALSDIRATLYKWIEPEHPADDMRHVDRIHLHTNLTTATADEIPAIVRVIDDKIREYLINRIIYGWMLFKAPNEAEVYAMTATGILNDLKSKFANSNGRARRKYHLF